MTWHGEYRRRKQPAQAHGDGTRDHTQARDDTTTSNTGFPALTSRQVTLLATRFVHPHSWSQPTKTPTFPHQHNEKLPFQQHVVSYNPVLSFNPIRKLRSPGTPAESRGCWRRRRDLNPRGAMHPYLLSREAHSTGLCDVSSADYSRAFSPRALTAPAANAQERSTQRRARDSNPRCHC